MAPKPRNASSHHNDSATTAVNIPRDTSRTSSLACGDIESRGMNDAHSAHSAHSTHSESSEHDNFHERLEQTRQSISSAAGDFLDAMGDDCSVLDTDRLSKQQQEDLTEKETRAVHKLKILVFGSLFLSMVAVVLTAYFLTSKAEQDNFELQFHDDAYKLLGNMGQNVERIFEASDAFVANIASFAAHTNQTWPFVTIPDFAVRAEKVRSMCGAVYVNTYHVVQDNQRAEWEAYTAEVGPGVARKSIAAIAEYDGMDWPISTNYTEWNVIFSYEENPIEDPEGNGVTYPGPYLPMWQTQPTLAETESPYNWDLMSLPPVPGQERSAMEIMMQDKRPTITAPYLLANPAVPERYEEDLNEAHWLHSYLPNVETVEEVMQPISDFAYPIYHNAHERIQFNMDDGDHQAQELGSNSDDPVVAALFSVTVYWKDMIKDILPEGSNGILVVFESDCVQEFTYEVNGPNVVYLGAGTFHDAKYDHMTQSSLVSDLRFYATQASTYTGLPLEETYCPLYVSVHASAKMEAAYTSNTPWIFALVTACVFLLTVVAFMVYNYVVEKRQKIIHKSAVTSNAIVSSLFPEAIKQQLMETQAMKRLSVESVPTSKLETFLNDGTKNDNTFEDERGSTYDVAARNANQIAELFPDTTIMFADIAGFTAWASTREPSHVFTLLETLYGSFDKSAKRMGIFKVETIGDSYVAVCGLPEPNKNHAVRMARFASSCLDDMSILTKRLEVSLGPGTADLALRVGLHSGPTIAGVLRGEKARFQLFGDTVNTASRMESSSKPNRIQASQKTAELIVEARRGHWLTARKDLVNAKGKGLLQTFWLNPKVLKSSGSVVSSVEDLETEHSVDSNNNEESEGKSTVGRPFSAPQEISEEKLQRLIDWNVELFEDLLKPIVQKRMERLGSTMDKDPSFVDTVIIPDGSSVRDQAVASVRMPEFEPASVMEDFELDSEVVAQLRMYITTVANLYRSSNPFHNFEHASHVIMSTIKLLQRVATTDVKKKDVSNEKEYYDFTFGISTDPLTKFAIVFSALIHDLDHAGVSNGQLVKEDDPIAVIYEGLSPMEQHSFTLAFELLMEDSYSKLRAALYSSQEEFDRFRQLCINCVIATDVFDKELKTFREDRWKRAFAEDSSCLSEEEAWHCKATITIEYIIQASDVAHTMQHWHVYQRWNQRLFQEMYAAYKAGRGDKDPSEGWYEGELWFFDNYVIPLAEKLRHCEVFGVDCDQLLDFANQNRVEWQKKGSEIVEKWKMEEERRGFK
ncbi:adenylate and guanylate cyclase catalytic domain containing protein [Nitzschia inconspicua]|uniref:Adenylate and guanylate cyclase catalytic domain containing protein n=1 Tax=Nitzschia inconspicua TaxID=303405 RepID=A0A9K3LE22_9STRA|nr:adenylate and guanylate cyclase catalytic domain containing protein [Nitzschia inconspicua]